MQRESFIFVFILCWFLLSVSANHSDKRPDNLVRSSCAHASYPRLCLRTLSSYPATAIDTPRSLALAAVKISLSRARQASRFLSGVKSSGGRRRRERSALEDCLEQISDSVDELRRTLVLLEHAGTRGGDGESFRWEMSNAETWVSSALTDEDTCLDGFDGVRGKVKDKVRKKIRNVAGVTSNALYMINRLDRTRG